VAAQILLCPACGARNKTKWEFCARCGEPLQGVTVRVAEGEVDLDEPEPYEGDLDLATRPESSLPGGLVLGVGIVILSAVAVAGFRYASTAPPPERADPGIFAAGSEPPAPPRVPPVFHAGAKDFEEGSRLLSQKRPADAILYLSRAAQAEPDKPEYQRVLAEAYWASGAREQAIGYFQRAASLNPTFRSDYAHALESAGRTDAALVEYQSIIAQNGGTVQVQESLGRLYVRTGNYAAAAPMLEKAATLAPTDPVLLQELAYALEKTNDRSKAVDVYRKVVSLAPDAPISRTRLAETLYGQGKADEALAVLKDGISRAPQQPLLQRQFGSVLERNGNLTEAAKAYRDYIQLAPNAADAKDLASRADTLDAIVAQRAEAAASPAPASPPAPTPSPQP